MHILSLDQDTSLTIVFVSAISTDLLDYFKFFFKDKCPVRTLYRSKCGKSNTINRLGMLQMDMRHLSPQHMVTKRAPCASSLQHQHVIVNTTCFRRVITFTSIQITRLQRTRQPEGTATNYRTHAVHVAGTRVIRWVPGSGAILDDLGN